MNMHSTHKRPVDGGEASLLPAWSSSKRARMASSDSGADVSGAAPHGPQLNGVKKVIVDAHFHGTNMEVAGAASGSGNELMTAAAQTEAAAVAVASPAASAVAAADPLSFDTGGGELDGEEEASMAAVSDAATKSTTAQSSSSAMDCPSASEISSQQLLQQILQLLEAGGGSQNGPTTIVSATASSPQSNAASPPFGASHLQLAVAQLVPSVLTSPFQLNQARDPAAAAPSSLHPSGAPAATPLLLAYALDTLVTSPSSCAATQRANRAGGGGGGTGSHGSASLLSDAALERLARCLGTAIQRGESTQGRQGMMQRHDLHQARNSLQRALARLLDSSQLPAPAQH
jgi:hypothetical protein